MIRSGTNVINLRVGSSPDRIKWARALLVGKQIAIDHDIRKVDGGLPEKSDINSIAQDIRKGQAELAELIQELLPRLRALPEGADIAGRIIRVSADLNRNVTAAMGLAHRGGQFSLKSVPISESRLSPEKSVVPDLDISSVRDGKSRRGTPESYYQNNSLQRSLHSLEGQSIIEEDFHDFREITGMDQL